MRRVFRIVVALVAVALGVNASAQQVTKMRIGTYKQNGDVVIAEASSTLAVDVVVEHEVFTPGVYARYAQKMLGTRASLVERDEYRVVDASVALMEDNSYMRCGAEMPRVGDTQVLEEQMLQIDRISSGERSTEAAAREAAEQILSLRRTRLDLITGEFGEGVFGAGLQSALEEISRLEREYLELFYGKRSITTLAERFILPVNSEQPSTIIARFSAESGIVAKDDLSGDIILVKITPSEMSYPQSELKGTVAYRYANNAEVIVALGGEVLARNILPLYEFGETVMFLQPR
ncbi:MAG: DUF4831 family protein [Alistipes sp.]|nr:DUF4831 family protein [Alistipes sp.]